MTINHRKGNLFTQFEGNPLPIKFIPHVCNDLGKWGKGFVIPLGEKYPKARDDYQEYVDSMNKAPIDDSILGDTVFTKIPPKIVIANMIAQKGIDTKSKPIRYWALVKCMESVRKAARTLKEKNIPVEIHAPKFGSGLAGGNWDLIEVLINELWEGFDTYIYTYE